MSLHSVYPAVAAQISMFWHRPAGVPAGDVSFSFDEDVLLPEEFGVSADAVVPWYPHLKKAALSHLTEQPDGRLVLRGARIDYETCRWITAHFDDVRALRPDLTPEEFNRAAWPGIGCAHLVIATADGYLLTSQRAADAFAYPAAWSMSLEEQIEAGAGADTDVAALTRRAIVEELGPAAAVGATARLHTAGREIGTDGTPTGIALIISVQLAVTFEDVTKSIAAATDRKESQQLVGVRLGPTPPADLAEVAGPVELAAVSGGEYVTHLIAEDPTPSGGWHGTAGCRYAVALRALRSSSPDV